MKTHETVDPSVAHYKTALDLISTYVFKNIYSMCTVLLNQNITVIQCFVLLSVSSEICQINKMSTMGNILCDMPSLVFYNNANKLYRHMLCVEL